MKDNRSIEEKLSDIGADYQKIPVPEKMKARLEEGIMRAEAEKMMENAKKEHTMEDRKPEKAGRMENMEKQSMEEHGKTGKQKIWGFRVATIVAAAAAVLIILPNMGAEAAYAMGSLPLVGKLFQAVTFRDYRYESERFDANVEVPQIVVDDMEKEETGSAEQETEEDNAKNNSGEKVSDQLQETVEQINFDIEEVTNQLIKEFQETADLGESYASLKIHHEVVTDNERYFTLKLSLYQGAGSGFESYKFYTIDKQTGKQVQISDLFQEGSNYNEILSENIIAQMKAIMAADESQFYWVDYEDVPDWNFEKLREDQNFYFDENGNIVISFDEYEVAPGYMGAQEFTVQRELFEEVLK